MLSPQRPLEMWSIVAPCLATTIGCMVGTWEVEKIIMLSVCVASAVAQVKTSMQLPLYSDSPPKLFQRANGMNISNPKASAFLAISTLCLYVGVNEVSAKVMVPPPLTLVPNTPSFILLSL
jgi:hypothetical protein